MTVMLLPVTHPFNDPTVVFYFPENSIVRSGTVVSSIMLENISQQLDSLGRFGRHDMH